MARPYTTPLSNILIQNNMIGTIVTPGASINLGNASDTCNNVVVQYNTTLGASPNITCGVSGSGNVIRGNIFPTMYSCGSHFTCSYNITLSSPPIGTGSKKCTPAFNVVNSPVADYHLKPTDTCAKNAGDPANYPPTDYDGNSRPAGGAPDAGADEVG